ncbi:MAG: aquaporin, partial [Panacagrimonas sp.]
AHFNPVVTLAFALRAGFPWQRVPGYVVAQFAGAFVGLLAAHAMFDLALLQVSSTVRSGWGQWWSEVVATFGLILVIMACRGRQPWATPIAVGAYIATAYWFTASTSFANPAVTLARGFTATFSGIEPSAVTAFVFAQLVGAALALLLSAKE